MNQWSWKTKESEWSELIKEKMNLFVEWVGEQNKSMNAAFSLINERNGKPSGARQAHQFNSSSLLPLREMKSWNGIEWNFFYFFL